MAQATASDVTARWARSATTEETALINVRLADVDRIIKRRISDLDAKCAADPVFKSDAVQVEADAVRRLVRNPEGYLSETDGSYTYMLSQEMSRGRLEILPEEWEILGVQPRGMFVLAPFMETPT